MRDSETWTPTSTLSTGQPADIQKQSFRKMASHAPRRNVDAAETGNLSNPEIPPRWQAGTLSNYADGIMPVLAVPEHPVPDGTRAAITNKGCCRALPRQAILYVIRCHETAHEWRRISSRLTESLTLRMRQLAIGDHTTYKPWKRC